LHPEAEFDHESGVVAFYEGRRAFKALEGRVSGFGSV
jgi:hypothetical protein